MSLSYIPTYDIEDFIVYEYSRRMGYEEYNRFGWEIDYLGEKFGTNYNKLIVLMISKLELVKYFEITKILELNNILLKKNVNIKAIDSRLVFYDYTGIVPNFLCRKTLDCKPLLMDQIKKLNKVVCYNKKLFVIKNRNKIERFNIEWSIVSRKIKTHNTYGKIVPVQFLVKRRYYNFFHYKREDKGFVSNGNIKEYITNLIITKAKNHNLKFLQMKITDTNTNCMLPEVILHKIKCYI